MLTVHHLERSRSHRVLWLLEELGVPYELVRYARDPKTMLAPSELQQIHPLGKSPVITDDGVTVAESGAIVEHVVEKHGNGRLAPAPGTPAHARYRYFLHYAEGSLMPPLLVKLIASRVGAAKMPFFARPIAKKIARTIEQTFVAPNLTRHLAFLEHELDGRAWFCGDELTAADIQMSYPLEAAASRAGEAAHTPNLQRVLAAMRARPAYARAIEKGGPVIL